MWIENYQPRVNRARTPKSHPIIYTPVQPRSISFKLVQSILRSFKVVVTCRSNMSTRHGHVVEYHTDGSEVGDGRTNSFVYGVLFACFVGFLS